MENTRAEVRITVAFRKLIKLDSRRDPPYYPPPKSI
jgi:hypothetical protein